MFTGSVGRQNKGKKRKKSQLHEPARVFGLAGARLTDASAVAERRERVSSENFITGSGRV